MNGLNEAKDESRIGGHKLLVIYIRLITIIMNAVSRFRVNCISKAVYTMDGICILISLMKLTFDGKILPGIAT